MLDNDEITSLYNKALINLSSEVDKPYRLKNPDFTDKKVSVICGSEVTIDLNFKENKISEFGYEVDGCSLTKVTVAVLKLHAIGKTIDELISIGKIVEEMLKKNGETPENEWSDFKILEIAKEYKSRHNSILLPFRILDSYS